MQLVSVRLGAKETLVCLPNIGRMARTFVNSLYGPARTVSLTLCRKTRNAARYCQASLRSRGKVPDDVPKWAKPYIVRGSGERAVFVTNCAIDGVKTYSLVELGESAGVDGRAENEYAGIAEQFARDL